MADSPVIRRLDLREFRNYERAECVFAPGLNVLAGANGQGKTNILEAIYYLAILRSFRSRQLRDLIRWKAEGFALAAEVARAGGGSPLRLEAGFGRERTLALDGAPLVRGSEFIHRFLCVAFIPEDIELVRGPSSERRRFLDILTSQRDAGCLHDLHAFNQALKSRNALLRRTGGFDQASRDVYDRLVVDYGAAVMVRRRETVLLLREFLRNDAGAFFAGADTGLDIQYQPGFALARQNKAQDADAWTVDEVAGRLAESMLNNRERDLREGVTTWGPQRDELLLTLGGRPLQAFGSEGQCRAASLLLRLASAHLLRRHHAGRGLVLLVDDVLGELDAARRRSFWSQLPPDAQVFFTCTEPARHEWPAGMPVTRYGVTAGAVRLEPAAAGDGGKP